MPFIPEQILFYTAIGFIYPQAVIVVLLKRCMMQVCDNSTRHIITDIDGKLMLVDTGVDKTFHDEYQGVRINDLSRMLGQPLDGVLGMDNIRGRVLSITRDSINFNAVAPDQKGAPLNYISGIPAVDIKINGVPCRAVIRTGVVTSRIAQALLSKDKYTRSVNDIYPLQGNSVVKMFVNYFSISNKRYFADAGELPAECALPSFAGVDAIIGADVLDRFDLIMDFSDNRLHLISY